MARPKALVVRAAGTNCDDETAYAFELCGARSTITAQLPLLEHPEMLKDYQILALPGGFSYGDDIAAGRVWALEMIHHAGEEVLDLVRRGGVVMGICNGFQVLVQMGLLPGIEHPMGEREVALTDNEIPVYTDRWVHLEVETDHCVFLERGEPLHLPLAHAEGKLVPRDDALLQRIDELGRVALRYVGPDGERRPQWPHNPNGSTDAVAGLTDETGRIFGLMPHPERHMFPFQHPNWTRRGLDEVPDGLRLFQNGVRAVQ